VTVREITAILVCWKDAGEFREAAAALAQARARIPSGGVAVSLVVVNNGGGGPRPDEVEALWPGATLLTNPSNRGFGPAVNQAARVARGDVLLLLNPDTRAEGEPFSPIARAFESGASVLAIAPRLVELREESLPAPGADEVLVETICSAIRILVAFIITLSIRAPKSAVFNFFIYSRIRTIT